MQSSLARFILGLACTGLLPPAFAQEPSESAAKKEGKTQVFVLGMIHSGHRTSELWGLDQVRETIRNINPDVICAEIPPSNWPGTIATWKEKHVVEDSRVKVFPEYVDVLLPLTDSMDFVVEPSAGWSEWMAQARRAKIEEFETADEFSDLHDAYLTDEAWLKSWFDSHPVLAADDDPFYIHSPLYDLRTKMELGPYEHHLNEFIGRPGGWTYINGEHFDLIANAIRNHPGERILVTFGAGHKYWFLEQLRWMPDIELMDVRPYLPNATAHQRAQTQLAKEEFLLGFDTLRVWWAHFRGDSLYAWDRVEAMLSIEEQAAFLQTLRLSKGSQLNEFHDGPFLGTVEVVSAGVDRWEFRAEVRRLHDQVEQATWLTATLIVDNNRPGGFAWTALQIPEWLLPVTEEMVR